MSSHYFIRETLANQATGFTPCRIMESDELRMYETIRLKRGFDGMERVLRTLDAFGWLIGLQEKTPSEGEVFQLDIVDAQGDNLQTWQITKPGFEYLRNKYRFKRTS